MAAAQQKLLQRRDRPKQAKEMAEVIGPMGALQLLWGGAKAVDGAVWPVRAVVDAWGGKRG